MKLSAVQMFYVSDFQQNVSFEAITLRRMQDFMSRSTFETLE